MGGLFQDINNATGGIFGESDASYNAKKANQNAASANAEAAPLRQQAGATYGDLSGLGASDRQQTGGFAPIANAGNQSLNLATANSPQVFNAYAATNDIYNKDPYALSGDQQTLLNSQLSDMQRAHDGHIQNWQASMAQRGITDPAALAAGTANLQQGFDAMRQSHASAFSEQAKQDREKAQANAMQYLQGQQALGGQQVAEGVGGAQNTMLQGAGGQANLAGQAANTAYQQQQLAQQAQAQNAAAFGGLLNLAGFVLSGGFNQGGGGGDTTASVAPVTTGSGYNPNGTFNTVQDATDPLGINTLPLGNNFFPQNI